MQIVETIPDRLVPEVEAALAWLNAEQGTRFEVTGLVDPELAERAAGEAHDLILILCEGDRCVREQLRVRPSSGGFEIAQANARRQDPPPESDPLPGSRLGWIDAKLAQHAFLVLVFYRGFW